MYIPASYGESILFCVITMACWGSWAKVERLVTDSWRFELFYWDYALGILLATLLLGFTWGMTSGAGRPFLADLGQASTPNLLTAVSAGVLFNIGNILLTTAMATISSPRALPLAMGIALVTGVTLNYFGAPFGHPAFLFSGVTLISFAIWLDSETKARVNPPFIRAPAVGFVAACASGLLLGIYYRLIAAATARTFLLPAMGKMGPYASVFVFALGVFLSSFLFVPAFMERPIRGASLSFDDYLDESLRNHLVGILGGAVWGIGLELSILAAERIGFAISFGLAQGALLVSAFWSMFFGDEYRNASRGTNTLLAAMLAAYVLGLVSFVMASVFALE